MAMFPRTLFEFKWRAEKICIFIIKHYFATVAMVWCLQVYRTFNWIYRRSLYDLLQVLLNMHSIDHCYLFGIATRVINGAGCERMSGNNILIVPTHCNVTLTSIRENQNRPPNSIWSRDPIISLNNFPFVSFLRIRVHCPERFSEWIARDDTTRGCKALKADPIEMAWLIR